MTFLFKLLEFYCLRGAGSLFHIHVTKYKYLYHKGVMYNLLSQSITSSPVLGKANVAISKAAYFVKSVLVSVVAPY